MNKNYLTAIIVVLVIVALAVGGYVFWSNSKTTQPVGQNTDGTSIPTDNTPVTQVTAPTVQTNSTTAPYISTVVVKGTVNPNGALTTYWYEYGLTSSLGTKTGGFLIGSGYSNIYAPAYITGLQSNTNYYFRLSAQNSVGITNGSTHSFTTNTTPAPTGTAPTISTLDASALARNSANLHGQVDPNGSETTFWFEYGTSQNLGSVTAFQSAGANDASLAVVISVSNLQPLTKYYFRLNAQNQFGTVNGQILNFPTKGPSQASAPTVKTSAVSNIASDSAQLHGNINPNGAATTYWFEYSDDSLLSNVRVF